MITLKFQKERKKQTKFYISKKEIVKKHKPFVVDYVNKLITKYPYLKDIKEDLISTGMEGLIESYSKFDPDKNVKFLTYAFHYIKKNIFEEINNYSNKGFKKNTKYYKIEKEIIKLQEENFTVEEIAEKLGITPVLVEKYIKNRIKSTISIDQEIETKNGELVPLSHIIPSNTTTEEEVIEKVTKEKLKEVLNNGINSVLKEKEKIIIQETFLANNPRNLADIGRELGISRERTRQIKETALKKLKIYIKIKGYSFEDFI